MQVQTCGTMTWFYRSAVKNFQMRHFVIRIYVKRTILTKIADTDEPQQWFTTDFLTVSRLNG